MTPEIEQAYETIISQRVAADPVFALVVSLIAGTAVGGVRVRPDAVLFLASNLTDLIIGPIRIAEPEKWFEGEEPNAALRQMLTLDIENIMTLAASFAVGRNLDYVSSTSVFLAVENQLPGLLINSVQVWGPKARTRVVDQGNTGGTSSFEAGDY